MWIHHPRKNGQKLKPMAIKFSPLFARTLKDFCEKEDASYASVIETLTTQSNNYQVQKKLSQFRELYRHSQSSDKSGGERES